MHLHVNLGPPHLFDFYCSEFSDEVLHYCQILRHPGSPSLELSRDLLTTSFESLKIWSLGVFSLLEDLSPVMKASYSTSLFVARKFSLRHCSKISPSGFFKTIHAHAPKLFLAPSMNFFQVEVGSIWGGSTITFGPLVVSPTTIVSIVFGGSWITYGPLSVDCFLEGLATGLSSLMRVVPREPCFGFIARSKNSSMKLAKTYPFIVALSKNFMSDCLSSMTHFKNQPDTSIFDKIFLSGSSVYKAMGCAWK